MHVPCNLCSEKLYHYLKILTEQGVLFIWYLCLKILNTAETLYTVVLVLVVLTYEYCELFKLVFFEIEKCYSI